MLYGIWEAVRTFFSNEFDECRPPFRIFVTKIGEKYDEREVGIRHQRRRLQFKRYSGAPRGRTQVRPSSTSPRMGKDNDFSGNRPNFAPTNSPSGTIFSGHCRQKTLPHASEPGRNGIHSPWLPPIRRQAKGRVPYSRRTAYTDPTRTIPTQKRISRRKRYNAVAPATCPQPSASTPDAAEYNGP